MDNQEVGLGNIMKWVDKKYGESVSDWEIQITCITETAGKSIPMQSCKPTHASVP